MKCKSCPHDELFWRNLCRVCYSDYNYSRHRRKIEKKQMLEGKPISQEWKRKPRWDYEGELKKRNGES